MIGEFEPAGSGVRAVVEGDHNLLLQQLFREVLLVLDDPGQASPVLAAMAAESECSEPRDPSLSLLLPPMSEDPAEAERLRALTEDFLRGEKSGRLRRARAELERVRADGGSCLVLEEEEAWEWLMALNDLRLALAGELSIDSDEDSQRVEDLALGRRQVQGRSLNAARIYLMVSWWQDSLLRAMRSGAD